LNIIGLLSCVKNDSQDERLEIFVKILLNHTKMANITEEFLKYYFNTDNLSKLLNHNKLKDSNIIFRASSNKYNIKIYKFKVLIYPNKQLEQK
jgi:hypothetical protein